MKVVLSDGKVYIVHWKIRPFKNIKSKKELSKTTCIIRSLETEGPNIVVAKESVSQFSKDRADSVLARKLSLTKALSVIFEGPSWKQKKKIHEAVLELGRKTVLFRRCVISWMHSGELANESFGTIGSRSIA